MRALPPRELPPRIPPPRELPPREVPIKYAPPVGFPVRRFQPKSVEGAVPFAEADDQAGDIPDFVTRPGSPDSEDSFDARGETQTYEDQQRRQCDELLATQIRSTGPSSPSRDNMHQFAPKRAFPILDYQPDAPSVMHDNTPKEIGSPGPSEDTSSEHSVEEGIAVQEYDSVQDGMLESVYEIQPEKMAHGSEGPVSPMAARQLVIDGNDEDLYSDEPEEREEERDRFSFADSEANASVIAAADGKWTAMSFVQRKLTPTFFRDDSRVLPMTNTTALEKNGMRPMPPDRAFVCPRNPSSIIPSEHTWEMFTEKKLQHVQIETSGASPRTGRSPLHEAMDLVPSVNWATMPANVKMAYLAQPLPPRNLVAKNGRHLALHAQIIRTKGRGFSSKFFPTYTLLVGYPGQEQVLIAAKKATGSKARTPYYILSTDHNCFEKGSESYIGKLRSNWISTEYTCFGSGKNPKKDANTEPNREEFLAVKYTKPGNAPRRMEVIHPKVYPDGSRETSRPSSEKDGLLSLIGTEGSISRRYLSKLPVWDSKRQTFTINFYGRVRHASSKNFQLIEGEDDSNDVPPIVQFGRWDSQKFHLDATYPFSILQAFSAALTTFDARTMESFKMTY